jgi:hypothetical protein
MSLPYESNVTNWGKIRCVRAWIEYPFADDGDTTSKIYNMECVCKNTAYVAPAFSDVMSSAAVADVIELPFAADSNAYFLGDFDFQPADGGLIRFVRKFAPVPSTRTRAIGSYIYTFPAFRRWTDYSDDLIDPATTKGGQAWLNDYSDDNNNAAYSAYKNDGGTISNRGPALLPPAVVLREPLTVETYAKITYTFVYATDQANVTPDALFAPIHNDSETGAPSGFFHDFLGEKTGDNPYEDAAPYIYDPSNGQTINTVSPLTSDVTYDKSIPDLTDYQDNYIDSRYINVESSIKSWGGNIFVKETISVLAK